MNIFFLLQTRRIKDWKASMREKMRENLYIREIYLASWSVQYKSKYTRKIYSIQFRLMKGFSFFSFYFHSFSPLRRTNTRDRCEWNMCCAWWKMLFLIAIALSKQCHCIKINFESLLSLDFFFLKIVSH